MTNENEALGLPPGSVRAILAIIIIPVATLSGAALMFLMFWKENYESALGILSGLTGMAGLVIGYYFGNKASNKATDQMVKAHQEVSEVQRNMIEHDREIINREIRNIV